MTSLLAPICLAVWGGLIILNLPSIALWSRSVLWAYLLPPLLAIDNLVVTTDPPVAGGLLSSGMAAVGFGCGFAILRTSGSRVPNDPWIGVPIAAAGLLLAL
jgi:hypothetical protein